ncbi:MAG: LysR family transcriptional regulator [Hyphomicrobiales bacterium]|nr:LysR family transcriptional regulator [Hyphomicrobiales bacterium]
MQIDLKHVRAFAAVARHRHFTRAAEELGVAQPTLSLLIRQLEDAVGVSLVHRNTRNVDLTEMGREFLPTAQNLVEDLSTAVDSLRDLAELRRGKVTVAALPSVAANLLPGVLLTYRRRFPDVQVRLQDLNTQYVQQAVRTGTADFGIGYVAAGDTGLDCRPLFEDEILLIVRPDHPFARRRRIPWRELQDEPLISFSDETSVRRLVEEALGARGIEHRVLLEPAMTVTVAALVVAGVGVGILMTSLLDSPIMRGLAAVPLVDPVITRPVGVLTRPNRVLTPAAEAMLTLVLAQFPDRPGP